METIQKRRALAVSFALAMCVMALPSMAFADDAMPTVGGVRMSAQLAALIVGALVPLLTSLLTNWKSKHAGFITILINVGVGLLTTGLLSDGTAVISNESFMNALPALVASFITYYGIYKPNGLTSSPVPVPGPNPGESITIPGKLSNVGLVKD